MTHPSLLLVTALFLVIAALVVAIVWVTDDQTRRDRKRIRGWKRERLVVKNGNRWL